jgi:3',5'-cyclic AMP phosphodiesterase CpdA
MTEFRLTQISDTHLSRADRFASLTENFQRISAHIDAARPDLVVNSGDVSWDGPTNRSDLEFAKELHAALPVDCRYLPGNHDVGDNPTAVGAAPSHMANERIVPSSSKCSAKTAGSSKPQAGASLDSIR